MAENKFKELAAVRPMARLIRVSVRDLLLTVAPVLLVTLAVILAAYFFVRPAPPDTITIASGPQGSSFLLTAQKYQKILARSGVKLKIVTSEGSLDNLKKLADPKVHVDVGFVQGGVSTGMNLDRLVSLGSMFRVPLWLFYRAQAPVTLISELRGKRLAIGPDGSGTHALALVLLKANGIEPGGSTQLLDLGGAEASQALLDGKVDAALLTGDSATPPVIRQLLLAPGILPLDFPQADAFARRYPYLVKLDLPMGALDFGNNVPPRDIHLIGTTVELIARDTLHPALSDLLLEAAHEVHGRANLMQHAGEFPAPLEHDFAISSDAKRYYTSGKTFLYRNFPFWLASLVDRTLVVFVPVVVLLIPGLKLVPTLYNWRLRSRIYRWYGSLIAIERTLLAQPSPEDRGKLLKRLDEIEIEVNRMKMPLAFAENLYVLRDHIKFVSDRYKEAG